MRRFRAWSRRCAEALRDRLRPAPDARLRGGGSLVIALSPLPLACRCAAGAAISLLACVAQLIARGQGHLAILMLAVFGAAAVAARRNLWLRGPDAPVRLEVSADGTIGVYCRAGQLDRVRVRPETLRAGGGLLLVLQGRRTYRLWLASGNVQPEALAALHRRLGRGAPGPPGLR